MNIEMVCGETPLKCTVPVLDTKLITEPETGLSIFKGKIKAELTGDDKLLISVILPSSAPGVF